MTKSIVPRGEHQGICMRERRIQWRITSGDSRTLMALIFVAGFVLGGLFMTDLIPPLATYVLAAVLAFVMFQTWQATMEDSKPVKSTI